MSYDFPFTLRDVAELCGIPTSTTKEMSMSLVLFVAKKRR